MPVLLGGILSAIVAQSMQADEGRVERLPDTLSVAHVARAIVFIETTAAAQATKSAFDIVDQGSRSVCLSAGRGEAGAEMDVMVNRGRSVCGVGEVGFLDRE